MKTRRNIVKRKTTDKETWQKKKMTKTRKDMSKVITRRKLWQTTQKLRPAMCISLKSTDLRKFFGRAD